MALFGQIIKSAIDISNALSSHPENPKKTQTDQLRNLLQKAQNTSFGLYYGFAYLLEKPDLLSAYQQRVPIFHYETLHQQWWKQQQLFPDITWPGRPNYFALSSGTTGKESKRIPVTDDMLNSFRSVGIAQARSLGNFDFPQELFEKEVLMLGSSANLQEKNGHLEGEISGINTSNLPPWFGNFYRPGLEIAQIDDWENRVDEIAKEAPNWDIGVMAGIPSWVIKMIQTIVERNKLKNIHEIWPGLSIYLSGGVAFEPYRDSLESLLDHPITYLDTYLASEGFFAYTARPGTMAMRLALDAQIFYEFIPFNEEGFDEQGNLLENPKVLTIDQVQAEQDYALLVSTPAGSWRYLIGDTVKFTDLEAFELVISGRTKYFLNVVGSQLSEEKINAAIQEVSESFNLPISEFSVAALKNPQGEFYHQWVLGVESMPESSEQIAQALDQALSERNKNYRVARNKALKDIQVKLASKEKIYDWLERRKKKGGQIKLPKVAKAEMMEDLLEFLAQ